VEAQCTDHQRQLSNFETIDVQGGVIAPGFLSYGGSIGLIEIEAESSTNDGVAFAPFKEEVPEIIGDEPLMRAADGGLSVAFSVGAQNRLLKGAIVKSVAALHVTIDHDKKKPSVSSQIAALRHLLSRKGKGTIGKYFSMVADGQIPLVVHTDNVDVIATLLDLLDELSQKVEAEVKLTISGGAEAHLLAKELGAAGVGVILTRPRPFPTRWSGQHILPGLPLTSKSAVQVFLDNNVTVGFGIEENWQARNAWFDAAWEAINAGGDLDRETALGLISVNLEKLLGLEFKGQREMVVWQGGEVFDMHSKVVAVISKPREQSIELLYTMIWWVHIKMCLNRFGNDLSDSLPQLFLLKYPCGAVATRMAMGLSSTMKALDDQVHNWRIRHNFR
ncbi:9724_t:CDS:2, partial [Acaulospora colombiana]